MRLITKQHLSILKAISKGESRFTLEGVYLEETEKGLKAVATDGRILGCVETTFDDAKGYPVIPALDVAPNTAKSAIVPVKTLNAINLPKSRTLPVLETIAVKMSDKIVTLATTDLESPNVVSVKPIEGHYPNFEQVIPKSDPKNFKIAISSKHLRMIADMVEKFEETKDVSVEMEFTTALKPVKVTAKKKDTTLTIVVMPRKVS